MNRLKLLFILLFTLRMIHIPELIHSARRAKMAYRHPKDIPHTFICSPPESKQDCQGYIWRENKTLYMTFRGTLNKDDMLANIDIRTRNLKNGIKIHHGFYNQFTSVEPLIRECIQDVSNVYITGHSLGGSISHVAAAHLAEAYPDIHFTCHTFGSPRVGNHKFAEWFYEHVDSHVRVVNKLDPVTTLPHGPNWVHLKNCLELNEHSIKFTDDEEPWYKRINLSSPIYEHDIDVYINRLLYFNSDQS